MSNPKPRLCSWLHVVWSEVNTMKDVIVKGWDKTSITQAFLPSFQLEAIEANTSSSLFSTNFDIEKNIPIYNDVELDLVLPISSVC